MMADDMSSMLPGRENGSGSAGNKTTDDEEEHTSLEVSMYQLQIVYYTIGTLGMLGNVLVLYVITHSPNMRGKITNMYILNQSTADFMGAFFMVMTSIFQEPDRKLQGIADHVYCHLWLTKWQMWSMFMVSTYSLILITIERYLSVVYAVWHKTSFSKNKAIASIVTVWILCILYVLCYMLIPTKMEDGFCNMFSYYMSAEAQIGTGIMNIMVLYLIPIVILVFCYSRMAVMLHRRIHPAPRGQPEGQQGGGQMSRAKNNVIKTLAAVSLGFIMCWTCNQVYYLMFNCGYPADFSSPFYHFTVVAIFCNCCINPVIYILKYDVFQKNVVRLFPWLRKCRRAGTGGTGAATTTPPAQPMINAPPADGEGSTTHTAGAQGSQPS